MKITNGESINSFVEIKAIEEGIASDRYATKV
jgi:hypothetical protein